MYLEGYTVAMITYCVIKMITCSLIIGNLFDTIILASTIKSGYNDPSKSKSWKVLESVISHLKVQVSFRHLQIHQLYHVKLDYNKSTACKFSGLSQYHA